MNCLNCKVITKNAKFCSLKCHVEYKNNQVFTRLESLDDFSDIHIARLRKYFKKKFENTCAICGEKFWNGIPIHLVLDHIDGNSGNWKRENLRMICPNCDAQTPTYKARNRGNGRFSRRVRYSKGLSY